MTVVGESWRQQRSEEKRTSILRAAQTLFVEEGYERSSVDAIAALAGVSKRTIYDHFGEKELVYCAVVDRVSAALADAIRTAIDVDLPEACDLRSGLLAFARRVATETFSSSDYVLFRRLSSVRVPRQRIRGTVRNAPKELFVERVARFVGAGALRPAEPWRVAEHFIALTFLLALDTLDPTVPTAWSELDEILVDGVDTFLRAYA
ncbi:TetR/AcrR family transcriptional regulator [Cryptosporangium sp. NPDC051539]|uniref:TetR/AcrR family transcriptional regulator n=1 Tax=Cryptosporangium sp. NPDC051539 TaxID=3363962 RepID=UPI0037A61614